MNDTFFLLFHICGGFALLFYAAATVAYVLALANNREKKYEQAGRFLLWATSLHALFLSAQFLGLFSTGGDPGFLLPNSALSISFVAWLLPTGYLFARRRFPLRGLGVFLAPLTMSLVIVSVLWSHDAASVPGPIGSPLLLIHIAFSLLGHAAFVGAFVVSLAVIVQETLLKRRSFALVMRSFPPLRLLDGVNTLLITAGVCAMSIGVFLGIAFALQQHSSHVLFSARVFWSAATLALYAGLAAMIFLRGFRGRRAAWISVICYATVVLSFASTRIFGAGFHVH